MTFYKYFFYTLSVMVFRLQYISNLHLYDKAPFPLIVKPAAKYLALAGNIGRPKSAIHASFMDYCSRNWEHTFYIPGSLETQHIYDLEHQLHNNPRLTLLNAGQMSYYLPKPNVAILGTSFLNPVKEREQLSSLLDYWEYQKASVCVVTHGDPTKNHIYLFRKSIKAWIYGDANTHTCGMYGTMYAAVNGSRQSTPYRHSAIVEFPQSDDSKDVPLQELAAAATLN